MIRNILFLLFMLLGFQILAAGPIVIMSDSTAVDYHGRKNYFKKPWTPMSGWGEYAALHVRKGVAFRNLASGGYSSKSYYNVWLPKAKGAFRKDGWLLLSFGSNDARPHPTWDRFTKPESTYPEYLNKIAEEAVKAGMKVVILSPIPYFMYKDGKFRNTVLEPYAAAAGKLAAEKKYYYIDLFQLVTDKFQSMSEPEIRSHYMYLKPGDSPNWPKGAADPLHFTEKGSGLIWQLIFEAIQKDIPELASLLQKEPVK